MSGPISKETKVKFGHCLNILTLRSFSWHNKEKESFNSLPASGDFCRLLITFANSLDPEQARLNVGHILDPNSLTL